MTTQRKQMQVYVIDDEASLRRALLRLMSAAGYKASAYANADEFLANPIDTDSACVIADVHTGGTNSLDLPDCLKKRGMDVPVIFITAYDNAETRDQVKKKGAAGYFRKPIDDQALIDAIRWAVDDQPHKH
jgi:FixJ family two-component response regulator